MSIQTTSDTLVFFPIFLGIIYGIILPLYFYWFPLPLPSLMPEAAAVALATLQNKLVALGPSVPNLGYDEAVCFLFLFHPPKSDFVIQVQED